VWIATEHIAYIDQISVRLYNGLNLY
jgi:hypothetical protein